MFKNRKNTMISKKHKHFVYVTSEYINPDTLWPVDGGLASYLCKITQHLVKCGYEISVVVADGNVNKRVSYNGVNVIFIPTKLKKTFWQKISWLFITGKKRHRIKSEFIHSRIHKTILQENSKTPIDLIQYASYLATGKCPETDIPSCVRISSYAKLWQKYYNYFNPMEVEDEVIQFQNARFLYGPSKYIADYIKKDLKLKTDIKIIETPFIPYNGQEDDSLYQDLKSKIKNRPYLIFYGSVGLLKGAQEIANSIYEIFKKHPKLSLVLVGKEMLIDGKSYVDFIKKSAKQYADRVIYYSKQPHETLFPLIRHAKAVLLPSRIDNLPNTCIEAMGLKKIVIGSRGASFEQLITDGESGILCQAGNAKSIVKAVDKLMTLSPNEIKKMEQKAYERSLILSPEKIVPQVLDYYNYVIKNWGKK